MFNQHPAPNDAGAADGLSLPSPEEAIRSAQRLTHAALESLSDGLRELADSGKPLIDHASDRASRMAQRGADAMHDGGRQLQEQARHAQDRTVDYIRHEPVRAMLIAAASGAALMALVQALSHARGRH
jgi:ElaB/YqjD/DUF883 family membrane-anchored ribosome-binding protein